MRIIIIIISIVTLLVSNYFNAQSWQELPNIVGPIYASCSSGDKIIASTQTNVLITENNGVSWDTLPIYPCLSFHNYSDTLFATSYDIIYKSADSGQTWISSTILNGNSFVKTFFLKDNVYFVSDPSGGIKKSLDFGNSWISTGGWQGPCTDIIESGNSMFSSFSNSGYFQRSNDDGNSWFSASGQGIKIGGSWPNISQLTTLCNNVIVAGVNMPFNNGVYEGVYFSSNNGDNWERRVDSLPDSTVNSVVSINDLLFIATQSKGIYYSYDVGHTWNELNNNLTDSSVNKLYINNDVIYASTSTSLFYLDINTLTPNPVYILDTNITQEGIILTSSDSNSTYQWLDCNNLYTAIVNDTNKTFEANTNGEYALEISRYGCIDTTTCHIINSVNILESHFSQTPTVYPNPTSEKVIILVNNSFKLVNVKVFNIYGRLISSTSHSDSKIEINLKGSPGIYFINIQSDENNIYKTKVIKQ